MRACVCQVRKGKLATSRARQFFDPAFPPVPASLGYIARAREVDPTLWKASVEMNPAAVVFSGGSDPDDVLQGVIQVRRGPDFFVFSDDSSNKKKEALR